LNLALALAPKSQLEGLNSGDPVAEAAG